MTEELWSQENLQQFTAAKIGPLVLYLSHESNQENGSVLEVGGGFQAKIRWQKSEGTFFPNAFTAEDVASRWAEITTFDRTNSYPTSMSEALQ
jgi:hypothetical protein